MAKIGIITFHRAINYGAVLQTYALAECVSHLGHQALVIDHKNQYIEKAKSHRNNLNFRTIIGAALTSTPRTKKSKEFTDFRDHYLNMHPRIDEDFYSFDSFITGSDQVWNLEKSGFDKAYFLDFVSNSKKKNSYAASFGFDKIPDEYLDEYKRLLADFNHLSVREEQGAEIIRNLLDRRAEVVLDPTMLLSRDDWVKISQYYTQKKDYILIYQLAASQSLLDFASDLSKRTNCEIVFISDALRKRIKATFARAVGPREFIGLFENAKYVVTNSFHGTAFSINFNKPFFIEMLPPPAQVNSRLENILDTFDLRSRQIINGKNCNVFDEIDYMKVNKKLDLERQRSLDFLKRAIEE